MVPITPEQDRDLLRRCFAIALESTGSGNHPFGALLADEDGNILMEQQNAFHPDGDMTGHAERVLMTRAGKAFAPEILQKATMYTSAEPCAMCAAATYWVGVGRVVYGLSEHRLKEITGNHPENPTLDLPCRTVFEAGQRPVLVEGPMLEDEAARLHEEFWARD